MLTEFLRYSELSSIVCDLENYRPFPKGEDRREWNQVCENIKQEVIGEAEKNIGYIWPALTATAFMEFKRTGNRTNFVNSYNEKRKMLHMFVLAECFEYRGRFFDEIINGVWSICEESTWVSPSHMFHTPGIEDICLADMELESIDLVAGETANLLAWIYYLLKSELDEITILLCKRIKYELNRRIIDPYLNRDDFWWMSFKLKPEYHINNWNPWCNYNCLNTILLVETDISKRCEAVSKCMRSVDMFLDVYKDDGGCEEGTTYWSHAGGNLFNCLELLYDITAGEIDFYNEEKIKGIAKFMYKAHISDNYFINFADGSAKIHISAELIYRYGERIKDDKLKKFAIAQYSLSDYKIFSKDYFTLSRILPAMFNYDKMQKLKGMVPFEKDVWFESIQVMAARERQGDDKGLYLAAKGGHNFESHNHNDIGNFIVYSDGNPVLIDIGVETYTAKTFSPERYEIWTMQSQYHNVPSVNGILQQAGKGFKATNIQYYSDDLKSTLSMNIQAAYPITAGIKRWIRHFEFNRENIAFIEIEDEYNLEYKLNEVCFYLMTCCENEIKENCKIIFDVSKGKKVQLEFNSEILTAVSEKIDIDDPKLRVVWGDRLYRITLRVKNNLNNCKIKINLRQI